MPSLEDVLLKSGAMTEAQLKIVRAEMERLGGSLDANILALGYLTEEALQRLLSQLFPGKAEADFRLEPEAEALSLVKAQAAREMEVVPQRVMGMKLYVLMHSPETMTQLEGAEGLDSFDLVAVGLNEVRLRYLLDQCYDAPREPRYVEIMDRLLAREVARSKEPRTRLDSLIGDPLAGLEEEWMAGVVVMEPGEPGRPEVSATPGPSRAPGASAESGSGKEPQAPGAPSEEEMMASLDRTDTEVVLLLDDDILIEVIEGEEPTQAVEATGAEGSASASLALEDAHESLAVEDFRAALDQTTSMDELPDLFFRFGVPHFKSVALFKVQSNMVMGWRGAGLGMVSEHIRGIVVPVQSDTFLARAIDQGIYTGQSEGSPVEDRILEQLGAPPDAHVITGGMQVANRPVLVVCCITEGEAPDPKVVSDFSQLCDLASETIFQLILERKKGKVVAGGSNKTDATKSAAKGAANQGKDATTHPPAKKKSPRKKSTRRKDS